MRYDSLYLIKAQRPDDCRTCRQASATRHRPLCERTSGDDAVSLIGLRRQRAQTEKIAWKIVDIAFCRSYSTIYPLLGSAASKLFGGLAVVTIVANRRAKKP
jgi:hypothetical protein